MIESFYFGAADPKLFGTYHAPLRRGRHHAVLLSPALGHEYVQCHFAYRALAARLAEAGFPVMRFEYRGLGNAEGELAAAELDDLVADIERALAELARRSGREQLCVAGIRLGATLSALAAGCCAAVEAALLWNPVVTGDAYVAEIAARHAAFLDSLPGTASPPEGGETMEVLGFRLGSSLARQLETIDGARLGRCLAAKRVLLLQESEADLPQAVTAALAARCRRFDRRCEPPAEPWLEHPHHVFLPGKALGQITAWMESLS